VRATGPDGKGAAGWRCAGAGLPLPVVTVSKGRRARSLSRFGEMESGGHSDSVFGLGDLILRNERERREIRAWP
jgi:hypothetical protein